MAAQEQVIRKNTIKTNIDKMKLKVSADCVVKWMRQ